MVFLQLADMRIFNWTPHSFTRPTINEYVALLERLFLLERLPPWHTNRLSRLVKTPKLHATDTGLACALLGMDSEAVANDPPLRGQRAAGSRFAGGAVLYDGETCVSFGGGLYAAPLRLRWETPAPTG